MATVQQIMQAMPDAFLPEKAGDTSAKIQFDFTGDGGGQYVMMIQDGKCEITEGTADDVKTTLTVAASDWVDIIEGRLDSMKAFMGGKLKVKGDVGFMMKFQQLFDSSQAQS